jgi:hypothetical protein
LMYSSNAAERRMPRRSMSLGRRGRIGQQQRLDARAKIPEQVRQRACFGYLANLRPLVEAYWPGVDGSASTADGE